MRRQLLWRWLLAWIILIALLSGLVIAVGQRLDGPALAGGPAATPSAAALPGWNWYWFRSQWQPVDAPQP